MAFNERNAHVSETVALSYLNIFFSGKQTNGETLGGCVRGKGVVGKRTKLSNSGDEQ